MKLSTYVLVALFSIFLASCATVPDANISAPKANTSQPKFIVHKSDENKQVIVFVPGIFGDAFDSWKNSNGKHFYDFVSEDKEVFDKTDIYVYGFDSTYFEGGFNIGQIAENLHARLLDKGIFNYDRVIFVAHSMGGLVVQKLLLNFPDDSKNVPLVYFFSTPQEGAEIANIAHLFLPNNALNNLIPSDQNTFLTELDRDWKKQKEKKNILTVINCAYENKDTSGVRIVSRSSATRLCEGDVSAINANHIDCGPTDFCMG
jgi:pimeloyl-ACP methyl ester carboxylesterase